MFRDFTPKANFQRRKRSHHRFDSDEDGGIDYTSPEKSVKKRTKLSSSCAKNKGWDGWMEGFEGVQVSVQDKKRPKRCKENLPKLPVEELDDQSQVDIAWESSEEDQLSDVEPLSPASPELGHGVSLAHSDSVKMATFKAEDVEEQTPTPSIDISSSSSEEETGSFQNEQPDTVPPEVLSISDYGSEDEAHCIQSQSNLLDNVGSQSPHICSVPTPSTSGGHISQDPSEDVTRGSQWIHGIKSSMKTPEKCKYAETSKTPDDSAKKRRQKFISHGMAERLKLLLRRQKTDLAFWSHKAYSQDSQDSIPVLESSKQMSVQVTEFTVRGILCVVSGVVIQSTKDCNMRSGEEIAIILRRSAYQQLNIQEGTLMEIHPPWKELVLTDSQRKVLLCTHCVRNTNQEDVPPTDSHSPKQQLPAEKVTLAVWKCPCIEDRTIPPYKCEANNPLNFPKSYQSPVRFIRDKQTSASSSRMVCQNTGNRVIQTEAAPLSIMESIERRGGYTAEGVSFVAQVVRIFCRQHTGGSQIPVGSSLYSRRTHSKIEAGLRWHLLLRDQSGCFCEVSLQPNLDEKEEWNQLLRNKDRGWYIFSELKVQGCATRMKNPGLFSCIDTICQTDKDQNNGTSPPGICYLLMSMTSGDTTLKSYSGSRQTEQSETLRIQTLHHILNSPSPRSSCFCKLIYSHRQASACSSDSFLWFITDPSLQSEDSNSTERTEITQITVRDTCYVDDGIITCIAEQKTVVLFLQDLLWTSEGGLHSDGYSRIYLADDSSPPTFHTSTLSTELFKQIQEIKPNISKFSGSSHQNSIVSVSGTISDVDEANAYTWPECNLCSNDKLTEIGVTGILHCPKCDMDVHNPVTKIRLDVFLDVSLPKFRVKVELMQSTICQLLPAGDDCDEGYELESVLGKRLGPLNCFLVTILSTQDGNNVCLKEICLP